MNHFIEKCSCGIVLSQCRCPEHKREMVSPIPCPHQPKPMTDQRARAIISGLGSVKTADRIVLDKEPLVSAIAAAMADERRRVWEEAAKVADSYASPVPPGQWGEGAKYNAEKIARQIRAKAHAGQEG